MSKILYTDLMEFPTDELAQLAYVTSGDGLIDSYSESNQNGAANIYTITESEIGQAITLGNVTIASATFYLAKNGSPTGNCYAIIYNATGTVGTNAKPTGGALATSDTVNVAGLPGSPALITFTFSTPYVASAGDFCIMFKYDGGDSNNGVFFYKDGSSPSHAGNQTDNYLGSWRGNNDVDSCFYLYGVPTLQSYSESSIKQQGSYSLKGIATTGALNDTLTKTLTDYLDYSIMDKLIFQVRSSRTGENLQLQLHDVGGTTSSHSINIIEANVWQTETWDLTGINTTDRDTIDEIIIKVINADAENIFYFDNLYSEVDIPMRVKVDNMEYATDEIIQAEYVSSAPIQDFLLYTEEDPLTVITKTSDRVTWVSMRRDDNAWVYRDFTVNYFDGDFEHLLDINITAISDSSAIVFPYALTNSVEAISDLLDGDRDALVVQVYSNSPTEYQLRIREIDGGTIYTAVYVADVGTSYYLKLIRDDNAGDYGTFYCYIYSDSARQTLLDTLSLVLHTSKKDFRYLYSLVSYGGAEQNWNTSGYTENLKGLAEGNILQCFSESTIKQQGSYSLKGIAVQTDSLNDTLTRTVSCPIDLSVTNKILFRVRASRTGHNFDLKIRDNSETWHTKEITIASADTWQTEVFDLTNIIGIERDAIDRIQVEIVNADAENIFYIDNIYGTVVAEHSSVWVGG